MVTLSKIEKKLPRYLTTTLLTLLVKLIQKSPEQKNPLDYLGRKVDASFFLSPTDSSEIDCIISQLKNGKAVGAYSIPCHLLKMLSPYISPVLAILINESFPTGVFPDKLKIAKVIALYKKVQLIIPQITGLFLSYLRLFCML